MDLLLREPMRPDHGGRWRHWAGTGADVRPRRRDRDPAWAGQSPAGADCRVAARERGTGLHGGGRSRVRRKRAADRRRSLRLHRARRNSDQQRGGLHARQLARRHARRYAEALRRQRRRRGAADPAACPANARASLGAHHPDRQRRRDRAAGLHVGLCRDQSRAGQPDASGWRNRWRTPASPSTPSAPALLPPTA